MEALSAGTSADSDTPIDDELVQWADVIFAMQRNHRAKIQAAHRTALKDTRIVVLGIPDDYAFMDTGLVRLLETKMRNWLT